MAKVNGPLLSFEAHGTIAKKLTYTNTRGQAYARARNVPTGQPSAAQLAQRVMYQEAVSAWHALTDIERDEWKTAGAAVGLTGFNAFMRYELTNTGPEYLHLTRTEEGASGRYIDFGAAAALANLGPCTWMVYHNQASAGEGAQGLLMAKTPNNSSNGPRLQSYSLGSVLFGTDATSGANGSPYRAAAFGFAPFGVWQHNAVLFTRSPTAATAIQIFGNAGGSMQQAASYVASGSGSGSIIDDSTRKFFMLNKDGGNRAYLGSLAWLACWTGHLTTIEMDAIAADGPLSRTDGLLFCFANGQDYGPNNIQPIARSTAVDGAMPPNTILGPLPS